MDKNQRYQELKEKKKRYEERLAQARKVMGEGLWHEDSSYEFAEQNIKLYTEYLKDIETEMKKLKKETGR